MAVRALKKQDWGIFRNHQNYHFCTQCGKVFNKKRNHKNKHFFCSRKCWHEWYRGENTVPWGKGEKVCLQCGNKFNPLRDGETKFGARGKHFCSKGCRMKFSWEKKCWRIIKGKNKMFVAKFRKEIKKAYNEIF